MGGAKTTEGLLAIDDPIESLKVFGANVYTVFPDSQPVGSLCKKVDKLQEARKEGHTAVQELYDNYIKGRRHVWRIVLKRKEFPLCLFLSCVEDGAAKALVLLLKFRSITYQLHEFPIEAS